MATVIDGVSLAHCQFGASICSNGPAWSAAGTRLEARPPWHLVQFIPSLTVSPVCVSIPRHRSCFYSCRKTVPLPHLTPEHRKHFNYRKVTTRSTHRRKCVRSDARQARLDRQLPLERDVWHLFCCQQCSFRHWCRQFLFTALFLRHNLVGFYFCLFSYHTASGID